MPEQEEPQGDSKTALVAETNVRSILTRTSGYLDGIATHSLQPYRGCSYGNSLCGIGCYVQHNVYVTRGRTWGSFLEVRLNAAQAYRNSYEREQRWARSRPVCNYRFVIFCASATDPFVPQERRYRITRSLLDTMLGFPPDELILQTHSHLVVDEVVRLKELAHRCNVRVHISIESDRDRLPGLPPPASPVGKRLAACATLKEAGIRTIVTAAPLLPIADPETFFHRINEVADAVILDHYIGGDGSKEGSRTLRTPLPQAMQLIEPDSIGLSYRNEMATIARRHLPGRVGIGRDGFAGKFTWAARDLG